MLITLTIFGLSDQQHIELSDLRPDDLPYAISVAYGTELEQGQTIFMGHRRQTNRNNIKTFLCATIRAWLCATQGAGRFWVVLSQVLTAECGCEKKCTQSMSIM